MGCNSNGFEARIKKGEELQTFLEDYLNNNKIAYAKTGYENLPSYNGFYDIIKKHKDTNSTFVRFYPDYIIVLKDVSILIEVKNSSGIEYNCYKIYESLVKKTGVKLLFLLKNKKLCKFEELILNTSEYDSKSGMKIPMIEGTKFRDPHQLNEEEYKKYINAYEGKTSGNAFAFIDFNETKFYGLDVLKGK